MTDRPMIINNPVTGQPMTFEEAVQHNKELAGGSVTIDWGEHRVLAPRSDVIKFLAELRAMSKEDRAPVMRSVVKSLERFARRLQKGRKLTPDDHQRFCQDMAIWFCNEVIDGRASIGEH